MVKHFIKKNYEFLFCLLLLGLILIISISPKTYINSTYYGFSVWAKIVLPSLFVFFILTTLLQQNKKTQTLFNKVNLVFNKLYKTHGPSGYIFFMSIISGYPIGAKLISEFYNSKQISYLDCKKILAFSSTSGPMFVLGSVASVMLNNFKIGIVILASHYIATLLNGLLYKNLKPKKNKLKNIDNLSSTYLSKAKVKHKVNIKTILKGNIKNLKSCKIKVKTIVNKKLFLKNNKNPKTSHQNITINDIMLNTITSVLMVGGFIALSFTILEILNSLKVFAFLSNIFKILNQNLEQIAIATFKGILELTSGCLALSALTINSRLMCVLLTGLITFGGVSIHLQSNIFLSKCNIKYSFFVLTKTTQTIISIILSIILSLLFC